MKFNPRTIYRFIIAGVSSVIAFISTMADQKQQNRINDMDKRIKILEENK